MNHQKKLQSRWSYTLQPLHVVHRLYNSFVKNHFRSVPAMTGVQMNNCVHPNNMNNDNDERTVMMSWWMTRWRAAIKRMEQSLTISDMIELLFPGSPKWFSLYGRKDGHFIHFWRSRVIKHNYETSTMLYQDLQSWRWQGIKKVRQDHSSEISNYVKHCYILTVIA